MEESISFDEAETIDVMDCDVPGTTKEECEAALMRPYTESDVSTAGLYPEPTAQPFPWFIVAACVFGVALLIVVAIVARNNLRRRP